MQHHRRPSKQAHLWSKIDKKNRSSKKAVTRRHTITTNAYLWNIFNFTTDAIIVNSSFNVTLNINWRAAPKLHSWEEKNNLEKIWLFLYCAIKFTYISNWCILFGKLLNCISSKCFIMHSNSMPLCRFWQVICSSNSLVKHTPCSNRKDRYSSTISQDLLHWGLPNFSTDDCLYKITSSWAKLLIYPLSTV